MKKLLKNKIVRVWLAIVGAATLIIGASYTMVQQSTRLAVDDLPLATAQTMKTQLESGASPNDVVSSQSVNLRTNNNLFAVVTDNSNHILASSAILDAQSPLPPKGTFSYTSTHGTDHFTWEPASGVRLATRVVSYTNGTNKGFIITGQSLSAAENRISTYGLLALAAWLATLAWTFLVLILPERRLAKAARKSPKSKK